MLAGVNDELGRQAYELAIAPPKRGPFKTSSGVSLVADLAIADVSLSKCRTSDTLIAAGGDPGLRRALESGEIAALIKAASRRGSRVVSVCTGTFLLAAARLA
jgi:transcriptional regulator GlxA family with amidase domain